MQARQTLDAGSRSIGCANGYVNVDGAGRVLDVLQLATTAQSRFQSPDLSGKQAQVQVQAHSGRRTKTITAMGLVDKSCRTRQKAISHEKTSFSVGVVQLAAVAGGQTSCDVVLRSLRRANTWLTALAGTASTTLFGVEVHGRLGFLERAVLVQTSLVCAAIQAVEGDRAVGHCGQALEAR